MLKEFRGKVKRALKSSRHSWGNDNLSLYRIARFVLSVRGQKKLWALGWKALQYLLGLKTGEAKSYDKWMKRNYPDAQKLREFQSQIQLLNYKPLVSIILPVYNTPERFLREAIDSVLNQVYTGWELCISDDNSTLAHVMPVLKEYASKDKRIKLFFSETNGHISVNSNNAIQLANGDFVALLDHDDKLSPDALFQVVNLLNVHREADFIYSDEDKIDENGKHSRPMFKPQWSPHSLLSRNYICHLAVIRKSLVDKVGGFRKGFEGSQDYDLFLRVTEHTKEIYHIPKILYHWRLHDESSALDIDAKPYAFTAAEKALNEALIRRGTPGEASLIPGSHGFYSVRMNIIHPGKVSIIIPTRNKADLCDVVLSSIYNITSYPDFEVILINNNSNEDSFFELVKRYESTEPLRFRCIDDNGSFNFSRLMNMGAKASSGDYLVLLNNDTEILHADWLGAMVEYAQFKENGAIGAKLFYPNDTVQHAGVIIGLNGIAGHCFVGEDRYGNGHNGYLISVTNYSAVTAACLMVRKDLYNEVGGFNEQLAVEFNDIDFCLKLADRGYSNIWLPHVQLYHYESISRGHPHKTKESYAQHLNDVASFKQRWQKYIDDDPFYNINLSVLYDDFRLRIND